MNRQGPPADSANTDTSMGHPHNANLGSKLAEQSALHIIKTIIKKSQEKTVEEEVPNKARWLGREKV